MGLGIQELAEKVLREFGEALFTEEGRIECFKKYGYFVLDEAKSLYKFRQQDHVVPKKMKKEVDTYREKMGAVATSKTRLTF